MPGRVLVGVAVTGGGFDFGEFGYGGFASVDGGIRGAGVGEGPEVGDDGLGVVPGSVIAA